MQNFRAVLVAACGALLVSACADPIVYVKPGASPTEWPQVRADCLLESMNKVPVDNRYSMTDGQEYHTRNCGHGGKDCSSYTQYTPPQMVVTDANEGVRDAVFQACLARNGWLPQRKPN